MSYTRPAMRAAGCLTLGGLLLGTVACRSTDATATAPNPPSSAPVVSTSPIAAAPAQAAPVRPMSVPTTQPPAPVHEFRDGAVYYAKILAVGTGNPGRLTLEMMAHYTGAAANEYAAEHGLPAPMDDHLDIDRGISAVVDVSPSAHLTIDHDDTGAQQLGQSAFMSWVEQHPAREVGGGLGGPLFRVKFAGDVLTGANEIFEP